MDLANAILRRHRMKNLGVDEHGQVLLPAHPILNDAVEDDGIAARIAELIFQQQLVDDPALAGKAIVVAAVGGGAQDPETNLA
nr:hypothetical protein [Marinicella sp. W31]MDC2879171.1 hypothetical protein [Marinicella sp. W31]